MTIRRGIIKYIDIDDTNNGYIEIDDRMKPMHDYPDNKNTLNLMMGGSELKLWGFGSTRRQAQRIYYIVGIENIITHNIWLSLTKKHIFEKKCRYSIITLA